MPQQKILRILTRLNVGGPAIHAALLTTRLDASASGNKSTNNNVFFYAAEAITAASYSRFGQNPLSVFK